MKISKNNNEIENFDKYSNLKKNLNFIFFLNCNARQVK